MSELDEFQEPVSLITEPLSLACLIARALVTNLNNETEKQIRTYYQITS